MNLFTDTIRNPQNGTDPFFNSSLPSFNSSLLDWGNFTGFNGKRRIFGSASSLIEASLWFAFALLNRPSDASELMVFSWKGLKALSKEVAFSYGNAELSQGGS